jgi:hypothetical protein
MSETYAYAEDELPLGQHTIRVTANDWAGNSSSQDLTVRRTCDAPAPSLAATVDPISTAAAIATVESEHPDVVASSGTVEIDGREFTPTLEEQGQTLRGMDTAQPSQIPESPNGAMVVGIGDQAVCLVPTSRGQHAGEATVVNGDSALYANTAQDVDSVVRPTVEGTEEFSILRSSEAPQSFSWSIASAQAHSVRSTQSGALSVEMPASDLAVAENPGTISVAEAQAFDLPVLQDLPPFTQFVNPENGAESRDAIREIAATVPTAAAVATVLPEPGPVVSGTPPPSGDPDAAAVQQVLAEAEQSVADARSEVVVQADDAFEASETSGIAEAEAQAANVASQAAADIQAQDLEIARIDAPVATDAEGTPVPLSLSSSGDQISVMVPHRGEGLEYPIAVDPIVETQAWEIAWELFPVYRNETYVSGQELTLKQVGWWDAKNCRSVSCAPDPKPGWYNVPGNLITWLPAGPTSSTVGPLYTALRTPVFETRQVLDHWARRQDPQVRGSASSSRNLACKEWWIWNVWQRPCLNASLTRTLTIEISVERALTSRLYRDPLRASSDVCRGLLGVWGRIPGVGATSVWICENFVWLLVRRHRDVVREAHQRNRCFHWRVSRGLGDPADLTKWDLDNVGTTPGNPVWKCWD